ncbi:MAG: J domain-containing protein [Rhodospirillaceae bacterium]|nr:J domain-containing protein [Rhodospirillaceae bacterium]
MTRARSHRATEQAFAPGEAIRACDHPDCSAAGEHRAPQSRDRLTDYYWFCLDHVRAYNKAWDYFQGLGPEAIEASIRRDTVWERPTWPLGSWRIEGGEGRLDAALARAFGAGPNGSIRPVRHPQWQLLSAHEREALALLDLEPPVTLQDVKLRYKGLVKKLHPDATGNDANAEERLKRINAAYERLKHCPHL